MLIDKQTRLSTAQALSASGATTDYLDTSKARNFADGEPLAMVFSITTAADYTTTDEAYTFSIQCDDNTGFSSPVTLGSRLYSLANGNPSGTHLTAGKRVVIPIPGGIPQDQYLRGYLTLGGTTPSVTFNCDIMPTGAINKPSLVACGYTIA